MDGSCLNPMTHQAAKLIALTFRKASRFSATSGWGLPWLSMTTMYSGRTCEKCTAHGLDAGSLVALGLPRDMHGGAGGHGATNSNAKDQCVSAVAVFASDPARASATGHLIAIFRAHILFELLLDCRLEAFASKTVLIHLY